MKELENFGKLKTEVHQEANKKQEYKFIGDIILKTGCKLFAYDAERDTMKEIVVKKNKVASFAGESIENSKAQYNPKYVYFQAINEKNARKKLDKYKGGLYAIAESFEKKKEEKLKLPY